MGLSPGSGRSPGGEHGNPLQDSCKESDTTKWLSTRHMLISSMLSLRWHKVYAASCYLFNICGICSDAASSFRNPGVFTHFNISLMFFNFQH